MPFWHVTTNGTVAHLVHSQATEEEPEVGSWPVRLWRGAPSWDSHPELEHAMLGIMLPSAHADFIRHRWTFDVPDRYDGKWNCGDDRQWMVLWATGGSMNWTLALLFPRRAPPFVYAAVAAGFHAELMESGVGGAPPRCRVLTQAIAAAADNPSDVAFLERLDDGMGGIKEFPAPVLEAEIAPSSNPALPLPAPLGRLSLAQRLALKEIVP